MVKSIVYTLAAIFLSLGFFLFVDYYIDRQFGEFYAAVDTLYDKVETGEANREDAYAVRDMWAEKRQKLHVFVPHNDVSYVDYWLNEACALIYVERYDLALGKLEVLREIAKNLPGSYNVKKENIF